MSMIGTRRAPKEDGLSAIPCESSGIEQRTPHHRRKGFMPAMMDMMDRLTITPGRATEHQEQSESKDTVALGSNNLFSTAITPSWSDCLDTSYYQCEFCGHRPPHEHLMVLHSHNHLDNHRMQVRREMYAKLDSVSQMVTEMRSLHLDGEQPSSQEAEQSNQKRVGRKMRTRNRRPR